METRETVPDVAIKHDVATDELVDRPSSTLWRSLLKVDTSGTKDAQRIAPPILNSLGFSKVPSCGQPFCQVASC